MKITPLIIKQQEFHKSLRGYDETEVKNFLNNLSEEFGSLNEQVDSLTKKNAELEAEIAEYKKIEKNLQNTLLNAQESTSKTVESVKKQAALILKEAELKAKQMVEKAKEEPEFINVSVAKLREERDFYVARLEAMIESQERVAAITHNSEKLSNERKRDFRTTREINSEEILEKLL